MISLTNHDSRVRSNSEVVIKFNQTFVYYNYTYIIMRSTNDLHGLCWDSWRLHEITMIIWPPICHHFPMIFLSFSEGVPIYIPCFVGDDHPFPFQNPSDSVSFSAIHPWLS